MAKPEKVIESISELPTLPTVVARVNALVNSASASAGDINDVISRDLALSSKVLKLVNSSFYGFPRRITSITHAVVILGFNTVRNLALSAFVFNTFKKGARHFDNRAFWAHSIGTAIAAQNLAQALNLSQGQKEDAFMAGLLHDIGKVVMCEYLEEDFARVIETVTQEDCLFLAAEARHLEYAHQGLGGSLLEHWNLPVAIVATVRHHHDPAAAEGEELQRSAAIVHVGDILARSLCLGSGGDRKIPRLEPAAGEALGLEWDRIGEVMDATLAEMDRTGAFFELV